jgi:ubiquinone/menaquinone biosynthesis C-methylase UbiE
MVGQRPPAAEIQLVCPLCKGDLLVEPGSYRCRPCAKTYPVLFGIPDFRLRTDRYLSIEEERTKAGKLYEFGQNSSFEELVRYYYTITYDLPANMKLRYQTAICAAPERARHIVRDLRPRPDRDILVDIGCGTGGVLISAQGNYRAVYGVDIALRWLVVCQKRLRDRAARARLICADAEAIPIPSACFTQAVAADLVEHVYDSDKVLAEIRRLLKPQGMLWLSASNRYCIGPHPLAGVWAIGFLPVRSRAWVLQKIKGIDLLRFANLVSPRQVSRQLRQCGFAIEEVQPKQAEEGVEAAYNTIERALIAVYRRALRLSVLRKMLVWIGPGFEVICRLPQGGSPRVQSADLRVRQ